MTSKKRIFSIFALMMLLPALLAANPRDPQDGPVLLDGDAAWDDRFDALGLNTTVRGLAVDGNDVYAVGLFTQAGGLTVGRIARWDGAQWNVVGGGATDDVYCVAVSGNDVYIGGNFTTVGPSVQAFKVARFNGSSWSPLGSGVSSTAVVNAIAVSGNDVYVGGTFTAAGGIAALRVAKWDGNSWSAMGTGVDATVWAIAVDGNDVYVGGEFTSAGGNAANRIARWNGSSWSALRGGANNTVLAIAIDGNDLYAGGVFTSVDGTNAQRIARWNGSSWSAMAGGVTGGNVEAIGIAANHDVYVGGTFSFAGGGAGGTLRIARWDGSNWSGLGSGVTERIRAIAIDGENVYCGGAFTNVGDNTNSLYFARWDKSISPVYINDFSAEPAAAGVILRWNIYADEEISGFRIYRREAEGDPFGLVSAHGLLSRDARMYADMDAESGTAYQYMLGVALPDGSELNSPPVDVQTAGYSLKLEQNYPNPFNPTTIVRFTLPEDAPVEAAVFDIEGKRVVTLIDEVRTAGPNEVIWNGRNAAGNAVNSGVYFVRLQVGNRVLSTKMLLLK